MSLDELERRLKLILPEEYQESYEAVQPVSMGSAPVKYDEHGNVAWDQMWATFCDLAMAGGPPHKGMLLEPGSAAEIAADADRYAAVVEEICRGIAMVTELDARAAPSPGWVRVRCFSEGMAGWLLRAIAMENVSVRCEGELIFLPAGPAYRVEKEIKNVITVIAKACHYWMGHMWRFERREISDLFAQMAGESALVEPAWPADSGEIDELRRQAERLAVSLQGATGFTRSSHGYAGWLGIDCGNVGAAVWMMRAMVGTNVLSRREGTVLFVPVNPGSDPEGAVVTGAVARVYALARTRGIVP